MYTNPTALCLRHCPQADASEQRGTLLPREKQKQAYDSALVDRYKHLPEVSRIVRHRHLPTAIYKVRSIWLRFHETGADIVSTDTSWQALDDTCEPVESKTLLYRRQTAQKLDLPAAGRRVAQLVKTCMQISLSCVQIIYIQRALTSLSCSLIAGREDAADDHRRGCQKGAPPHSAQRAGQPCRQAGPEEEDCHYSGVICIHFARLWFG